MITSVLTLVIPVALFVPADPVVLIAVVIPVVPVFLVVPVVGGRALFTQIWIFLKPHIFLYTYRLPPHKSA